MERAIQTEKELETFAKEFLATISAKRANSATTIGLVGDLGSGKTTFVQKLAFALGITKHVTSPTFVIEKIYIIENNKPFTHFIHIDAYRLDSPKELTSLGFETLTKDPENLIVVEWADKVKELLPPDTHTLSFIHNEDGTRIITW